MLLSMQNPCPKIAPGQAFLCCKCGILPGMSPDPSETEARNAIDFLFSLMEQAWNTADVSAYAQLYTEDVGYVNRYGVLFTGRAEVARIHAEAFAGRFHGTRLRLSTRRLRLLGNDCAVAQVDVTTTTEGDSQALHAIATVVLTQGDRQWHIAALQVGETHPPS